MKQSGKDVDYLYQCQQVAKKRGGVCLSKKYQRDDIKLKFRCKHGHEWETKSSRIRIGKWCPYCAHRILTIDDMNDRVRDRGGVCLSKIYKTNREKLKWQCREGHVFFMTPAGIARYWCPHCGNSARLTIEEMQARAKKKGGKCLSKEYINVRTKLKWQCKNGHQWEATPHSIGLGKWCPQCFRAERGNSR